MTDPLQQPVLENADDAPPVHPFLVDHLRKVLLPHLSPLKSKPEYGVDGAVADVRLIAGYRGAEAVINYLEQLSQKGTEE